MGLDNKQPNNLLPTSAWISEFDPEFSFYKKPIKNIIPSKILNLVDAYLLIKGSTYRDVTDKYRRLFNTIEGKEFKREKFDS